MSFAFQHEKINSYNLGICYLLGLPCALDHCYLQQVFADTDNNNYIAIFKIHARPLKINSALWFLYIVLVQLPEFHTSVPLKHETQVQFVLAIAICTINHQTIVLGNVEHSGGKPWLSPITVQ